MSAAEFEKRAKESGVKVSIYGPTKVRLVTNKDVSREDVLYAADVLVRIMKEAVSKK